MKLSKPKQFNTNKSKYNKKSYAYNYNNAFAIPLLSGASALIFTANTIINTNHDINALFKSTLSVTSSEINIDAIGANEVVRNTGSGFLIKLKNGKKYGLTNYHVVGDAFNVFLHNADNKKLLSTRVIYEDIIRDIAILDVSSLNTDKVPFLSFCKSDPVIGEHILAIGDPYGLEGSISRGIVSGVNRLNQKFIQIDAAINFGSSGGPLISEQNNCILGMNTAKSDNGSGIGFAIPSSMLEEALEQI
jgi:S1-C subfamily serine protease